MRVLVISRNAWDNTNSIGNTLSNFFCDLEKVEFANIYFRPSSPANQVCMRYYRITEGDILKHWFSRKKIGKSFQGDFSHNDLQDPKPSNSKKVKSTIRFIQKHDLKIAYKISDSLWNSKKWINDNLDSFITSFAPDVVFSFVKAAPQYYLTIRYLREKYNIPLFTWIADDEYTGYMKAGSDENIGRLRYILDESSVVCGCSQKICDYYHSVFGCSATPLYKGCDFSEFESRTFEYPINIVYAGNLLYGRLDVIRSVSSCLEKFDNGKNAVIFDIYSNTALSESDRNYFDDLKCTRYLGKQSYNVIADRLGRAHVVLHVESFEESQIIKTKYSFSTKIIDCLQSGSVLLAVGPAELASIEYVKHIPGAYVIEDQNNIYDMICGILNDFASFDERSKQINGFARMYHDTSANTDKILHLLEQSVRREA